MTRTRINKTVVRRRKGASEEETRERKALDKRLRRLKRKWEGGA